jgi:hypothetical protein
VRTAAIGLAIGAVIGVAISIVWLKVDAAVKRRRDARALAEWDAYVTEAVRLSETPLYEGTRLGAWEPTP